MLVTGGIRVVGVLAEYLGLGITLALMSVSLLENGLY